MSVPSWTRQTFSRNRGRIAILMVMLVWLYFLVAFGEQAWRANQLQAEVDAQRTAIQDMQRENAELREEVNRLDSPQYREYVESVARRDLNLANPGETVLLVRWEGTSRSAAEPAPTPQPASSEKPNWRQWLDLFSHQP